ncbi:F0F1 ATP synthase subunit B [Leptolyngbya sp. FACHB-36]|uniref:F0F1 ATP synthase subunit B n=1 Tax=Leptolyngbya sp. FACHB-36 TaxID=2692808 RepID=UPI001680114A|nr:F0F1 ATP synthase subunit B [Leptolyngbya sp. FACHB-36]MBD2022092.1 F0F1 ATP synthase subunit B [Leptolyngbya sp. FACHB-36]
MDVFLKLAMSVSVLGAETAEAAEKHGFGLNFDIFESNLINLSIVIALLVYFGRNFLGKTLGDRRAAIETAIREAEVRRKDAAAALADQQQKLAQAQSEAAKIRSSAEEAAKIARAEILAKAEQDIQRMREVAAQDLSSEQERVITELRQRVVALALQQVESELPTRLNDDNQRQLVNRSIAMIGGS